MDQAAVYIMEAMKGQVSSDIKMNDGYNINNM